ncbi:MAG: signal peptidase II [Gaiellaceae bacterium]
MSRPATRLPDVRVGSSTDGLAPVSRAERPLSARLPHWAALVAIAVAAVVADQLTKHAVTSTLALGEESRVLGPLSIHHVQNTGIAFGLLGGATAFVTAFTTLAVCWMLLFFARSGARHGLVPVALGFLSGGSVSNLVDRLRLGHVTDFLDLGFWPTFNLADTFIVVGVALLVLSLFAADRNPRRVPVGRPDALVLGPERVTITAERRRAPG